MRVNNSIPNKSWSLVVTALAELGRTEIERRRRAAAVQAEALVAEDQTDDGLGLMHTLIEAADVTE
jgi:hypothetical protein